MITIPSRLLEVLRADRALTAAVESSLHNFEILLQWSRLPFFPEYTDHGEKHLTDVLRTADALISENCRDLVTPGDACVLVLSVLLHDVGMHLNEKNFLALICSDDILIPDIDNKSWSRLWQEFIAEARRFDGKTLIQIFGDIQPISVPSMDPEAFTLRDRRLIGEFLRRHHPRLAHEVALRGMPGASNLRLAQSFAIDLSDLTGLAARSHGFPIRKFLPYIQKQYHLQEYKNIHLIFLMCLLRISDYLQVQAERAPTQHLQIAELRSPVSKQEWRKHSSISNITTQDDDPEAVFIQARPKDVRTFLALKTLLYGLQNELDTTWAVLGEVYGRREKLRVLGLELRRVKSNLDDEEAFAKTATYLPYRAAFEAADAELLKLLAEPLYGANVNYGVRELLQNSVDACLELWDIDPKYKKDRDKSRPDILLSLNGNETEGYLLTINDRGIGMTANTVRDYFLKAGASYRKSDEWKILHEDSKGHSRVLRSGRFGIGVLAAFILGNEITVRTRYVMEDVGLEFTATLDTETIEMKYADLPAGTTISVKVDPAKAAQLMYLLKVSEDGGQQSLRDKYYFLHKGYFGSLPQGLYLLEEPSLWIAVNEEIYELGDRWPYCGKPHLSPLWHRIKPAGFAEVHWTYERGDGALACNGIAIGASTGFREPSSISFAAPTISVFDPDANLPLNLTRTQLAVNCLPFNEDLVEDVWKDLCAYMLSDPWEGDRIQGSSFPSDPQSCRYKGLIPQPDQKYLCTSTGFTLCDPTIIKDLNIDTIVIAELIYRNIPIPSITGNNIGVIAEWIRMPPRLVDTESFGREYLSAINTVQLPWGSIDGVRLYTRKWMWDRWQYRIAKATMESARQVQTIGEWTIIEAGKCGEQTMSLKSINRWNKTVTTEYIDPVRNSFSFAEYHLNHKKTIPDSPSFVSKMLKEILGGYIIPYCASERREIYRQAFINLREYVEFYELAQKKSKS